MSEVLDFMRNSDLFANLDSETRRRVATCLRRVRFEKDDVICREGDSGSSMFIIARGEVTIGKAMGWGQHVLDRFGAGDVFGEMALISNEPRTATVTAVTETECLRLDQEDYDRLLDEDPHFARRVAKILSSRLSALGRESSQGLLRAHQDLIFALAGLAEDRDPETGAHLERIRDYCALLADLLSSDSSYSRDIRPTFVDAIYHVSPLHDIGKVAIPDVVLLKQGKLTEAEFETMKTHTIVGAERLKKLLDEPDRDIFHMAHLICLHHHERWDGSGYPTGIGGTDIPLSARIMSIADVFDALASKRVYKEALSYDETFDIMRRAAGSQFDPEMIEMFLKHGERFAAIHQEYSKIDDRAVDRTL